MRLVIDAIKTVIGAQIQFVTFAITTHFQKIGNDVFPAEIAGLAAHRGKAAVILERDVTAKYGVAGRIKLQLAFGYSTHHAIVDRVP